MDPEKYNAMKRVLDAILSNRKFNDDSRTAVNDVIGQLVSYVHMEGDDSAEVQLFFAMRLMNAMAAKAAVALATIREEKDPMDTLTAYQAAIDCYQYQISVMKNGIEKEKAKVPAGETCH